MFKGVNIRYEMDERHKGIASGGIGVIHLMAKRLGLVKEIDRHLHGPANGKVGRSIEASEA
jgi:hypothetical protein